MNDRQFAKIAADRIAYRLFAPIISAPGYEDLLRPHRDEIIMHRFLDFAECEGTEMSTEFEAMWYLHTLTLMAPVDPAGVAAYTHLFKRFFGNRAQNYEPIYPFDDRAAVELKRLRKWIYRRQIEGLKGRFSK